MQAEGALSRPAAADQQHAVAVFADAGGVQRREFETSLLSGFLGRALLLALVFHAAWRFGTTSFRKFRREPRDALFMVSVLALEVLGTGLASYVFDAVGDTPLFGAGEDLDADVLALQIGAARL